MAGTVGSVVAQETVGVVLSFLLGKREEKASEEHNIERLEVANIGLEYALERTSNLPIIDRSLRCQRKMIKRVSKECGHVLSRHKLRVLEATEAQQGVHSSLPKRITHALKSSISSVIGLNRDGLNLKRDVARFEWLAGGADKFVRDVAYGCSLSRYRFFPRLFGELCQGKTLEYKMAETNDKLWVLPVPSDDFGVLVHVKFNTEWRSIEEKCFHMSLLLRLSESLDIVETMRQSLQTLEPPFKSFAEDAAAELTQLLTEDDFHSHSVVPTKMINEHARTRELLVPWCDTAGTVGLSSRYSENVMFMRFVCYISDSESDPPICPFSRTLAEENWRILKLSVMLSPHSVVTFEQAGRTYSAYEEIGEEKNSINCSLHEAEEIIRTDLVNRLFRQRDPRKYVITWLSTHGAAQYQVRRELPLGLLFLILMNHLQEEPRTNKNNPPKVQRPSN